MKLEFSERSLNDLAAIYEYGVETFGMAQAQRYEALLVEGINRLVMFPMLGKPCVELGDQKRQLNVESHVVFYEVKDDRISILTVLGSKQNWILHFQ